MKTFPSLGVLLWFALAQFAHASSATWLASPTNGNWFTATNWMPNTIPNDLTDIATFDTSSVTNVSISSDLYVSQIIFGPDASAYSLTISPPCDVAEAVGVGITNNSGIVQNFVSQSVSGRSSSYYFSGQASAGTLTHFTTLPDTEANSLYGGEVAFFTKSTAGTATFENLGAATSGAYGGLTIFYDASGAGGSNIVADGATGGGANGGVIWFMESSNAEDAVLTANGGTVAGANGGVIQFGTSSQVSNATVIANGGTDGGGGGAIRFDSHAPSTTDTERIELFGNGFLDISRVTHHGGLTIGSLEGDGIVHLGSSTLTVGSNGLSTTFSGIVMDDGAFVKSGDASLILSGANTYTGGTTVSAGTLRVANTSGSATGSGAVTVSAGVLGGKGTITGAVTMGTGSGPGAILQPSVGLSQTARLTIQSALTFKADSSYTYKLSTQKAKADQVVAGGVTIEGGAQFNFTVLANKRLAPGTIFTAISNTAATPISGAFANLADGSTVTFGRNRLQVSYSGGDGNDLTLTVE